MLEPNEVAVDFELDDEQRLLRDAIRSFLDDRAPVSTTRVLGAAETGYDHATYRDAASLGLPGLVIPAAHDGGGGDLVDVTIVAEECGRALYASPLAATALVAAVVSEFGTEEQCARVLPGLAAGTETAAAAVAEAGRSWSVTRHEADAVPVAGGFTLRAAKTTVEFADPARWLLVTAGVGGDGDVFLVDRAAVDVTCSRLTTIDLTRSFYDVAIQGAHLGADAKLPGNADAVRRVLDLGALLACADAIGAGRRLLELTVQYARDRVQFGRPIGSFQAIKHKAANMSLWLQASWVATYYAALALSARQDDAHQAVGAAKAYTGDAMSALAGEALQIHGGIGMTWEADIHLYLRRIKTDEVLFGTPTDHCYRLADDRLGSRR